jgi:hypothetical protein
LIVVVTALLILWKIPALLHGRLWAEDGLFLLDALKLPWWQALVTPHTGYIDVLASGAMVIATRITDLEHVALVSVGIALIVQICPVILLLTSRCDWLRPPWVLAIAVLLVVTPPVAEEVWLSPVTSQYHLILCTCLILAFEVGTGMVGIFQLVLLGIAGLTGPGPALAAPLFIARALLGRSPPRDPGCRPVRGRADRDRSLLDASGSGTEPWPQPVAPAPRHLHEASADPIPWTTSGLAGGQGSGQCRTAGVDFASAAYCHVRRDHRPDCRRRDGTGT